MWEVRKESLGQAMAPELLKLRQRAEQAGRESICQRGKERRNWVPGRVVYQEGLWDREEGWESFTRVSCHPKSLHNFGSWEALAGLCWKYSQAGLPVMREDRRVRPQPGGSQGLSRKTEAHHS
jgi:hypothetical protein